MANTTTGIIHKIEPTQSKEYNGKVYYQRQIVIDATRYDQYSGEARYPNFPAFSFSGDKCAELDSFRPSDMVTIAFEVQGRKYIDKHTGEEKIFNKVAAYKIELYNQPLSSPATTSTIPSHAPLITSVPPQTTAVNSQSAYPRSEQVVAAMQLDDDLPF